MEIIVHTLVKNEDRYLWYAVMSVINYVDKIMLWDTGSTDESIQIEKEIVSRYPGKAELRERKISSAGDFTRVRQEMLDATKGDWFLMLDGDEIWWEDSIKKVIETIKSGGNNAESLIVPTVNLVGDIFHYQEKEAGRYRFGKRLGHYNLRAINRKIPGLHSQGEHGVWGWADGEGKMIQERSPDKIKYLEAPYLHTTFLQRATGKGDLEVIKRAKKLKREIGISFPKDFYYPEVFFRYRPDIVESPWKVMNPKFKFRAVFETPLRKVKRRLFSGKIGY